MSGECCPDKISQLARKLAEIQAELEALASDQIDAVIDPLTSKPLLLRPAQEALIAAREQLEQEVLKKASELERTIESLKKEALERKNAEDALLQSEEKFRLIANYTYDWETWLDQNGNYIYVSPACERITGHKAEEFIKNPRLAADIVHPDDREAFGHHRDIYFDNQTDVGQIDYRIITTKGEVKWIGHFCQPIFGKEGEWLGRRESNRDITMRKKTEDSLRKSEAKYRVLFQNMAEGFALYELLYDEGGRPVDWQVLEINDAYAKHTGIPSEQIIGRRISEVFPLAIPEYLPRFAEVVATQTPMVFETYAASVGRYQSVVSFPAGGSCFANLVQDITQRKKAEETLRKSEQELRLAHDLLEQVTLGTKVLIATVDKDLRYTFFNQEHHKELRRLTGKNTAIGMSLMDILADMPKERDEALALWNRALNGEVVIQTTIFGDPGRYRRWYSTRHAPIRDPAGSVIGAGEVTLDITDSMRTQVKLKESEERLRVATESARAGMWSIDIQSQKWEFSPQAARLFGLADGAILTFDLASAQTHPDDLNLLAEQSARSLREEGEHELEYRIIRPDGEIRWLLLRGRTYLDAEGRAWRNMGVMLDITERKQMEDNLKKSEEKSRLLVKYAPSAIYEVDFLGNKFISVNDVMCSWLGYTREELLAINPMDLLEGESKALFQERIKSYLAGEKISDPVEYSVRCKDGRLVYGLLNTSFIIKGNVPMGAVVVAHDITERKLLEKAMSRNSERMRILSDVASQLLSSDKPQEIIEKLCRNVMTFLDCDSFFNYLVDEEKMQLILNACAGIPAETAQEIKRLDFGVAVCGCVARDGRRIVMENMPESIDPSIQLVKSLGIKAYACHPLISRGKVIGTLSFGTRSRITFSEDDLSMMQAVADQVAIALSRVKLDEELRQLNEKLEQRIEERTAELKAASLYSRILLESSLDPLFTISPEGMITDVNKATELATGITRGELIGTDFADYFTDPDAARAGYLKVLAEGDVRDYPLTIGHMAGKTVDVLFNATVYPNKKGALQGVLAAARDVTQLKQAESALIEAKDTLEMINKELHQEISKQQITEKELLKAKEAAEAAAQAKAAFMANMSHEIRTPMNAVIGMTSILLDEDLTAEQKSFVEVIRSGGDALLSIINEILDFSRLEKERIELEEQELNLSGVIEEALDMIAPKALEKKLNLAYAIDKNTPTTIIGDPTRIRQILINLLDNAVKFTEKGEVVINVSSKISNSTYDIHFAVKDTGIGIPPDSIESIFEAFNQADNSITRKYGGTGLGLAISRKLVKLMGGDIWLESEEDKGSIFHFNILVKAAADRNRMESISPLFENKSILIVEDNKTNRRILGRLAKDCGMVPTTAGSKREVRKLIQSESYFDIAILEIDSPEIDGLALGKEMRLHNKNMPLVMLTYAGQKFESDIFQATLSKPLKPNQFYNILTRVFSDQLTAPPYSETVNETKISPLKILLAEDNDQNQKVALQMLRKSGYNADLAANGLEVLQALDRQKYDIILMDVRMPEMNGLDASRIIRQRWPGAKPIIIAVTAYGLEGDREKCLDAGMDDYISKPIKQKELQSMLSKYAMFSDKKDKTKLGRKPNY